MSRNSYGDYATYMKNKNANCFYNLAKEKFDDGTPSSNALAFINAHVALLFDKHNVDAREIIKKMCNSQVNVLYSEINSGNQIQITNELNKDFKKLAITKYKSLGFC
jgi:hypothetical protein